MATKKVAVPVPSDDEESTGISHKVDPSKVASDKSAPDQVASDNDNSDKDKNSVTAADASKKSSKKLSKKSSRNASKNSPKNAPKKGSAHGKAHRLDWHNVIDVLAFMIGLFIFLYPLISSYVNYSEQTKAVDTYDAIVSKLTPSQRAKMWKQAKEYDKELGTPHLRDPFSRGSLRSPLDRYWKTLNVDGHGMMAYVQIPKINVKLPVYHGTSDPILAKGTGHVATTHLPTDNKTVHSVITGHTGLVGHIFFDNLTQMKKGDTFEVRVLTHHLTYKVDSITVIWPTQVKALQPVSNHNYVTLLTCTPYRINDHRLLVRGKFVGESKPLTQPTGLPLWYLWLFLLMVLLCVIAEITCRKRRNRNKRLLKEAMSGGPSGEALALLGSSSSGVLKSRRSGKNSQVGRLDEKKIRRHMRWQLLGMWVFSILAIFLAWASFGMMMRTGFLPAFDLGYSWWDQHVTYWFSITGMKHLSMPINF